MATNTVGAVAGTKLYIGTTETLASPDDYIEIKEISSLGSAGGTNFNKIAIESVGSGYTRQIKGTELAPVLDLTVNRLDSDPGQIAVKAASSDRVSLYNFKIEENDGAPVNTLPTRTFFKGRVYGWAPQYGGVNDVKRIVTSIEIEPDSLQVVAAV